MAFSATTRSGKTLHPDDVHALLREFQAMTSAGVPLHTGLSNSAHGFSANLEQIAVRLADRLEQGVSISEACQLEPELPSILRPVLVAGFRCGNSRQVAQDLLDMSRVQLRLRRAIQQGLIYPIIITFTAVILFGLAVTQLLARAIALYRDLHSEVPAWMSWIRQIAGSLDSLWVMVTVIMAFIVIFYLLWRTGPWLRFFPGTRQIDRDLQLCHLSQLLALFTSYGIPLPEALRLTSDAAFGPKLERDCNQLADVIESGASIDEALASRVAFPDFLKWLIITGHQHSELPIALRDAGSFYQRRAEMRARRFGRIFPLFTITVLGGSVTFAYVLAVFVPMTNIWMKLSQY